MGASQGGPGVTSTPGPWPGQYVPPYAPVPSFTRIPSYVPVRGSGFNSLFWVIGLIVAVVILGTAGAIAYSVYSFTRDTPFTSGGGWTPGSSNNTLTAQPGKPLSVSGVDDTKTIGCNQGTVNVSGVRNTITITGHCVNLQVSGIENHVTVDSADTIGASGINNQVTYKSGTPRIDSAGDNVVQQG
jgi:Protein of unknown function (DUF3060)